MDEVAKTSSKSKKKASDEEDREEDFDDRDDEDREDEDFDDEDRDKDRDEVSEDQEDTAQEDEEEDEDSPTSKSKSKKKQVSTAAVKMPDERWLVKIKMEADVDEDLQLVDLEQVHGSYLLVRKKFFEDLLKIVPKAKNYVVGKGIQNVTSPDGADWTRNSWLLVMAKESKAGATYWLLIKRTFNREQNHPGFIVAIGPDSFTKSLIGLIPTDEEARNEYLKKLVIWLTIEPAKWDNVGCFIPNWT